MSPKMSPMDCEACRLVLGVRADSAIIIGRKRTPRPGDMTVCGECGTVLTFAHELRVRRLTPEEFANFEACPGEGSQIARHVSAMMRAANRARRN